MYINLKDLLEVYAMVATMMCIPFAVKGLINFIDSKCSEDE